MARSEFWTGHSLLYILRNMKLLTALKEGRLHGVNELPIDHIETVMSHVLIYENVVRKIYKDDREGVFLNLKDPAIRKQFYVDDFLWNQDVSPQIHLYLHGAKQNDDGSYTTDVHTNTDDWFVEMKRIKGDDTLYQRLLDNAVSPTDIEAITQTQTTGLQRLSERWMSTYEDLQNRGLSSLWIERLDNDLRQFGYNFGAEIATDITDHRVDTLLSFFNNHAYFKNLSIEDAEIAIDNHAGNVVFTDDGPQFIDIYLLKREWRVIDRHNNIARLATCVRVLGNDDLATAVYDTYAQTHSLAPQEIYDFMEAYNALIKGYYYTYLERPHVASRYFNFADSILKSL